jgi:hypothetical protein
MRHQVCHQVLKTLKNPHFNYLVTSTESVTYPEMVHYQSFTQQHNHYQPPSVHGDFYKYPFVNFTENHLKEYYFTEGIGLRQYVGTKIRKK